MTKLSFAVLFLFFTLSLARSPLTQSENDVTHLKLPSENDVILPELPKNLPESDVTLPELPEKLPENGVRQLNFPWKNEFMSHEFPKTIPESDDSTNNVNLRSKSDHEETRTFHTVPLKLVRFRPINRRFRLRSNLPFRLCHHHLKPLSRRQIPFGNDMILSSQRNFDFDKFVYRIGGKQIPSDPFIFHQHNDKKISKFSNDREKYGEMKKDQSPHHHHHDDNEDNDHQQRKISKFLDDREKFGEMNSKDQSHHHHHHYDGNEHNDHEHEQRKISKFLEDSEKFWGMNVKDQSPHHHHHHHHHHDEKAKEKKKGGFMRGIRKFLHHYFD